MSDFHIVVFFNDYYTLIVAFWTKQIQNRYRCLPDSLYTLRILKATSDGLPRRVPTSIQVLIINKLVCQSSDRNA